MERVAIFGGSFNPVHNEHIALAKCALSELGLDRLIVMPTYIAPHKSTKPAPAEDRLNMLRLAFAGEDKIEVSDYEITKGGTSFTYQTVEYFKSTLNANLFFLVGADMLKDFKTWRNPERILSACTLATFGRMGEEINYDFEREYFKKTFGRDFVQLKSVGKRQSSTQIRVYNELDLDITDKTAIKVANYIKEKGLYKGDEYSEFVKKTLPEKRLIHTANVVGVALSKAKELNLDSVKVRLACLLHDVAKYIDHTKVRGFELEKDVPAPVAHAFLGAFIAKEKLNVVDEEVINAIKYHTSGRANMTTLEKLVFVADMIEESRNYEGVEKLRSLFYNEDFEKCFTECLSEELIHLLNKKQYVYKETLNACEYYLKKK